jgi:uncharacterized protein (TIGR03437 family)
VRFLQPTSNASLIGSVLDAASQRPAPISPGKIIVIYGAGLGPAQMVRNQPRDGIFSAELAGSAVFINGTPAPVVYTSDMQVAAVVPYAVSGASALVTVRFQGQISPGFEVPVAIASPGIFSSNGTGAGQAAAVNGDGSVNDAAHPVKVGDYLSLFLTGQGQTTPAGSDGKVTSPVEPLAKPLLPVAVQIAGVSANVIYAGAAPTQISGLMQVVVQIPDVQPGGYVPIEVRIGGISTGAGAAWIAVAGK